MTVSLLDTPSRSVLHVVVSTTFLHRRPSQIGWVLYASRLLLGALREKQVTRDWSFVSYVLGLSRKPLWAAQLRLHFKSVLRAGRNP